ncbi:MAG TPA: geranylgeranyl reductase family protein [Candidatus Thermoplasmatota archaeon]|nr:geranylgeranyl reductase family protein [Candidatus Thermoplasmatota archaeon]
MSAKGSATTKGHASSTHAPADARPEYDVIVCGGGPGGSTAATFLAREGLTVLLVDKAGFPRDKPCGDAVSGKSAAILRELGLTEAVEATPHTVALGVLFSSPAGDTVSIKFPIHKGPVVNSKRYNYDVPGYVCRREVFDDVLFQHAKALKSVTTLERHEVVDVLTHNGRTTGVLLRGPDGAERRATARVVVGADGAMSVVAQAVGAFDRDPEHWVGSYRSYFRGVKGLTDDIEIHFLESVLPGYFWIFPLDNGLANVGIGVLESEVRRSKGKGKRKRGAAAPINMRKAMYEAIAEHPMFKERFAGAVELPESRKGWLLPLGSKHRPIHGEGWVLVGDAAALIDPFSGEGIGNAMVSARLASRTIAAALAAGGATAERLAPYEAAVRAELDEELKMSHRLQKLGRVKFLLNFVIRRAARKPGVQRMISDMLADREKKEAFGNVWFYFKLLVT